MADRYPTDDLAIDYGEQERCRNLPGRYVDPAALLLDAIFVGSPGFVWVLKDELEVVRGKFGLS